MARPIKTATSPDYRAKIRTVAQALFAERGFASTTIREIADQTGVNSGLLYHYYPNKAALYLSLLEAAVGELVAQMEHIAASTDTPEMKIRRLAQVFLTYFETHPQSFRLVQRALDESSPAAQALAQRWFSRAFATIHAIATEGVEQGFFRPLAPALLSFAIAALLEQTMRLYKIAGDLSPDLSGAYLFDELPDLLVGLLRVDAPGQLVSVRRRPTRSATSGAVRKRRTS